MNLEELLQSVIDVEEAKTDGQNSLYSSPASLLLGNLTSDKTVNKRRTVEDIWKDILHNHQSICQKSVLGAGILNVENQPQCLVEDDSMFKALADAETQFPIPSLSPASFDSHPASGRKRALSGKRTETTTERRKNRMIKNRESAARSRARKQEYTNLLEHRVFQLREINGWLKKQEEVDRLLSLYNPQKFQLRRTSSTTF